MTRLILKFSLPVRRLPSPSRLLITSFFCTEETSASHGLFSLAIMDEVITSLFFRFYVREFTTLCRLWKCHVW
jgi:hypothetical protein